MIIAGFQPLVNRKIREMSLDVAATFAIESCPSVAKAEGTV